jgi:hypothetical protein
MTAEGGGTTGRMVCSSRVSKTRLDRPDNELEPFAGFQLQVRTLMCSCIILIQHARCGFHSWLASTKHAVGWLEAGWVLYVQDV